VNNADAIRSVLKIAKTIARIGANRKKILAISVPGPITEGINLYKISMIKPINRILKTQKIASITIKINKRNSVRIIKTEQKTLLYKITANDIQTTAWDFHKLMGSESN
jgi:hypothetical protein